MKRARTDREIVEAFMEGSDAMQALEEWAFNSTDVGERASFDTYLINRLKAVLQFSQLESVEVEDGHIND